MDMMDIDLIMKVFLKKAHIPNIYKYGKNDRNSSYPCKPYENFLFSSLSLLVKSVEEEIQLSGDDINIARG